MAGAGIHPYHQQWAAAQQQQQPPPATVPPPPMSMPMPPMPMANPIRPPIEEVRTIFISGLPEDVKDRELQNLMRWLPGFEASQLNFKGEQPMGFALFSSAQFAIAAKDALQDMVFDPEAKSVLHTEMAKKNLFVKRGVIPEPTTFDQSKRMRTGGDYTQTGYQNTQTGYQNTQTGYQSPSPFQPPPAPVWGPPQGYMAPPMPPPMAPAPPPYDPYAGYAMAPVPMPTPAPVPAPSGYAPVQNAKDNPPCNTLFIGNLGENTIEEELRGLFSVQPGFKQMKVLRQERNTVCFIEFDDVNNATNVHTNLQGAVIPSSGRGGMRIQYSKNPFGRRKDGFPGVMQMPPEANGAPQMPMPMPIPMPTYQ